MPPSDDGGSNVGAIGDASNDDAARCDVLAVPSGAANEIAIEAQLRQASDIGKDGTQNPSATCDAITIGGNLTGVRDATAPEVPAGPDPCQ